MTFLQSFLTATKTDFSTFSFHPQLLYFTSAWGDMSFSRWILIGNSSLMSFCAGHEKFDKCSLIFSYFYDELLKDVLQQTTPCPSSSSCSTTFSLTIYSLTLSGIFNVVWKSPCLEFKQNKLMTNSIMVIISIRWIESSTRGTYTLQ